MKLKTNISKFIVKILLVVSTFIISSFSSFIHAAKIETSKKKKYICSYYHDKFNNRLTASGTRFHNDSLSVATSDERFFGKRILFEAKETGKKLILICNDRMNPRMKGIVHFDLTKKAMKILSGKEVNYPGHIEVFVTTL